MSKKLFVGSLPYSVSESELEEFFAAQGTVTSAVIIKDRETGQSKGFGFVEMEDDTQAENAIKELNGKEMQGRTIVVNEARPQVNR